MENSVEIIVVENRKLELLFDKIETLESRLSDISKNFVAKEPEEYLSKKETAEMFGITLSTLDRWTKKGFIKRFSIGNRIFYKRSQIQSNLTEL